MAHPTQAGIGLVRMGESSFVPANLEDDVRGKDVYDPEGQRLGSVEDLYIDRQEREVRFLEVGAGGFLGIGEKRFLVPVEAVVEVAEEWVAIELGSTEKVEGPAPFDTKVAPPPKTGAPRTMLRPLTATPVMPQVAGATPTQRSRSTIGRSCRGRYACEPPTGTPALPRPPTTEDTPTKCGALRGLWSRLSCPIDPPNAACGAGCVP